jgi:hypothetical membrane protein
MEIVQYVLISGLFCFYASLRNKKTDSKVLNIVHSIYSFSCLIGFLVGINTPEIREYAISWLALPLIMDIAGRYLTNMFHQPVPNIFKRTRKKKRGIV